MRKCLFFLITLTTLLNASVWTDWTEDPGDPIYTPFPSPIHTDYFPYVIFYENNLYQMWHEGDAAAGNIATSLSTDGVNWTLLNATNIPTPAEGPVVLYDPNGFGVGGKPYRMWYWTGIASTTDTNNIKFSESNDGVTWDPPISITQDPTSPLVIGIFNNYFFSLFGPSFIIYNPSATSIPGEPYTFPYVMFFDTISGPANGQIGLAYSSDGLLWKRYGSTPILLPSNSPAWDDTIVYHASVFQTQGVYHMFYSAAISGDNNSGIGHASSTDGINWEKDADNPIFTTADGVAWRAGRTYAPFVLFHPFCDLGSCPTCFAKMWFNGGSGIPTNFRGDSAAIGYATLPCPPLQTPLPPLDFDGVIQKNIFLNKTECILTATWIASPSVDVVLYRIYLNGVVVAEIPATDPLVFTTCLSKCKDRPPYEIAAVNSNNVESVHVEIVYV